MPTALAMNRPYMNNHVAIGEIKTSKDFFIACNNRKSIYFRPLNRVMPIMFFMGWSWGVENIERHIEMGSFYDVMNKEDRVRGRIKRCLPNYQSYKKNGKTSIEVAVGIGKTKTGRKIGSMST